MGIRAVEHKVRCEWCLVHEPMKRTDRIKMKSEVVEWKKGNGNAG